MKSLAKKLFKIRILSPLPPVFKAVGICLLLNVLLAFPLEAQPSAPVRMYDTHGLTDPQQWTQVLGTPSGLNPKHLVLDNGVIRLTFPATGLDQQAAHVLYLRSGTNYILAADPYFGDWVYVNASVVTEYTGFWILQNTDDMVSIRLEFANHRNTTLTDQPCPFTKTLTLAKGHYGYVVHIDIAVPQRGEKEVGFGRGDQYTFFYNADKAHVRPDPSLELYTRNENEQKNYWAAGLPSDNSFLRFVAVSPAYPGAIRTAEWYATAWGYFYQWTYSAVASYEAYIGVLPYDASKARSITVTGDSATVEVPRDGNYTLLHQENGQYVPAFKMLALKTGLNQIALQGKVLNAPVVVPIANGTDFPEDIAQLYVKRFPPMPSPLAVSFIPEELTLVVSWGMKLLRIVIFQ